jgi:hypothetical protein
MTRVFVPFILFVLLAGVLLFALPTIGIQLGLHAHLNPAHNATSVREAFDTCPKSRQAELYSEQRDTWMYLCFMQPTGKVALWIITNKITQTWREVTAFFPRNPANYLPTVIARDGYKLISGELPQWLSDALKYQMPGY